MDVINMSSNQIVIFSVIFLFFCS